MKALKFLGNRVEDAANAFIDVLKYSDQSVDYPDFKDIEPWPEDIVNMFKDALKDKPFSEISAILMYTQQSSRFEPIAELIAWYWFGRNETLRQVIGFLTESRPS